MGCGRRSGRGGVVVGVGRCSDGLCEGGAGGVGLERPLRRGTTGGLAVVTGVDKEVN